MTDNLIQRTMRRLSSLILLMLFVALGNDVNAQANFREGHIVFNNGETLSGLIRESFTPRKSKVCIFKEDKKAKKEKYYPEDIKSYGFTGDGQYESRIVVIKGQSELVFARVLLEGPVNLYYHGKNKEVLYHLEKEDNGEVIELVNRDREIELESNWTYNIFRTYEESKIPEYKNTLYFLFEDSQEAQKQVNDLKYNHKAFINITKTYLNETCDEPDCITYENDLRKVRERFGVYSGVYISAMSFEDGGAESLVRVSIPIGMYYQIPLSFIHNRLFFQNELIYRRIQYDPLYNIPNETIYEELEWDVIGIPLLLQYKLSTAKVSPVIGFGKELGFVVNSDIISITEDVFYDEIITATEHIYKYQKGSWFVDLGIDFELSSDFSIFTKFRLQRHQNKVIANKYENQFTFNVANGTMFETYSLAFYLGLKF